MWSIKQAKETVKAGKETTHLGKWKPLNSCKICTSSKNKLVAMCKKCTLV